MPTHDPAAMEDIQAWVEAEGERLIFVYGEHDPWTGGAFAVPERDDVLRVTAPRATHAAMIRDLDADAQARVLDALEAWMGARPQIGPSLRPSRAPAPPGLRYEGFVR